MTTHVACECAHACRGTDFPLRDYFIFRLAKRRAALVWKSWVCEESLLNHYKCGWWGDQAAFQIPGWAPTCLSRMLGVLTQRWLAGIPEAHCFHCNLELWVPGLHAPSDPIWMHVSPSCSLELEHTGLYADSLVYIYTKNWGLFTWLLKVRAMKTADLTGPVSGYLYTHTGVHARTPHIHTCIHSSTDRYMHTHITYIIHRHMHTLTWVCTHIGMYTHTCSTYIHAHIHMYKLDIYVYHTYNRNTNM